MTNLTNKKINKFENSFLIMLLYNISQSLRVGFSAAISNEKNEVTHTLQGRRVNLITVLTFVRNLFFYSLGEYSKLLELSILAAVLSDKAAPHFCQWAGEVPLATKCKTLYTCRCYFPMVLSALNNTIVLKQISKYLVQYLNVRTLLL